ncbi:hypothetical protein FHL15_000666 [Xylaria flabelliformis]|uniref:Uncharacterized protein n=1 Tax=Xylaria flabelliformis TaxID=2512241 RepID=A0A553IEE9_9PEZI|nr:hypothetical protein FHL15_000666 [Xylaria flabelliformis]
MSTQPTFTNSLKRKASRWQTLPSAVEETDTDMIDNETEKYSLLLFLRDIDSSPTALLEFVDALQNAPGSLDDTSTIAATLAAALDTKLIDFDYIDPELPDTKKRRLNLYGNSAAADQIAEYDSLVKLARTVWTNPDDLRNFIGKAYQDNLRQLADGHDQYSIDDIFDFARSWGEVRYRFMNHALRDDPTLHTKYNSGRENNKGNAANTIVHESNLLLDARMVEFQLFKGTGYNTQDRAAFQELYILTPEEGRSLLRFNTPGNGLRIGLPAVFRYCVQYIDAYFNWRVRVLESARKQVLTSPAYKNANFYNKQTIRTTENQRILADLQPVDTEYTNFIVSLRNLIDEAEKLNAFNRMSYDAMDDALSRLTRAVRSAVLNRNTFDLRNNRKFQSDMATFPNLQQPLIRPTGSSMIAPPRRGRQTTTTP